MNFIAQFDLTSDVSMPTEPAKHSIQSPTGNFCFVIRKVVSKEGERLATFRCNMEFESEALGQAQHDFMDRFRGVLDILSLVTHAIFRFHRLYKIFDWTPSQTMRSGLIFVYDPPESPPEWVLDETCFEMANLFQHANLDDRLMGALHWFRRGIIADTALEQFQNFWFALELLAQHEKTTNKVHDRCPTCRGALYCKTCDTYPMHRPYPIQAIQSVWETFASDQSEIFRTISEARNLILHGESERSIEATAGVPLHEMVDPLSKVTWTGLISAVVASLPEDKRPSNLTVGVANTFVKWDLTAVLNVSTVIPMGPNGTPDIERLTGISAKFVGQ